MTGEKSVEIELLTEIRDLLRVIAEPGLAARDMRRREVLLGIVGKSKQRANAVLLMDGTSTQAAIIKKAAIDQGNLSRLTKALRGAGVVGDDEKHPKLAISIPPTFFDYLVKEDG